MFFPHGSESRHHNTCRGGIKTCIFSNLHVSGQLHTVVALPPGKRPPAVIGAGLETVTKIYMAKFRNTEDVKICGNYNDVIMIQHTYVVIIHTCIL